MSISYDGFLKATATFETSVIPGEASQNSLCKLNADGSVSPCIDGDQILGLAEGWQNGVAAVQVQGYIELPYTGTAPSTGRVKLIAAGPDAVKTGASGVEVTVLHVDATTKAVGFLLK